MLLWFKSCTLIFLTYFLQVRDSHCNKVITNKTATFVPCLKTKIQDYILFSLFVLISLYDDVQIYLMVHFFMPSCNKATSLHMAQYITVNVCWTFIEQHKSNSLGVITLMQSNSCIVLHYLKLSLSQSKHQWHRNKKFHFSKFLI